MWEVLSPGRVIKVNTFEAHRWVVKIDGKVAFTWVIEDNKPKQKFVITAASLPRNNAMQEEEEEESTSPSSASTSTKKTDVVSSTSGGNRHSSHADVWDETEESVEAESVTSEEIDDNYDDL